MTVAASVYEPLTQWYVLQQEPGRPVACCTTRRACPLAHLSSWQLSTPLHWHLYHNSHFYTPVQATCRPAIDISFNYWCYLHTWWLDSHFSSYYSSSIPLTSRVHQFRIPPVQSRPCPSSRWTTDVLHYVCHCGSGLQCSITYLFRSFRGLPRSSPTIYFNGVFSRPFMSFRLSPPRPLPSNPAKAFGGALLAPPAAGDTHLQPQDTFPWALLHQQCVCAS